MKLILFLIFLIPIIGLGQTDCILKLDKDSIQVYSCDRPNSKFKLIKSTFPVNGTLSALAAMILDVEYYNAWQYKTIDSKVLKRVSNQEIIYYTQIDAPIIASNRDFVIRLTIIKPSQSQELTVEAVSIPDYLPPVKGVVRVPYSFAKWKIKALAPNRLMVEYTIEIDLGGAVPPWLVNLLAHQAPYETFKALRADIGKYHGRKVPFMDE